MRSFYRKRKIIFILLIVVGIVSLSSITYAIFTVTTSQSGINQISTMKCLELTFSNQENAIDLTNTYPMTDERGAKNTPYTFTVTNNCEAHIEYTIGLMVDNSSSIADGFIKTMFSLKEETEEAILLTNREEGEKYENNNTYILKTDSLSNNESKNYSLRLWLDYDATNDAANKSFSGKIIINAHPGSSQKIIVDLDGGTLNQAFNLSYQKGDTIELDTPTKADCAFAGWEVVGGDGVIEGSILTMGEEDCTIKATWISASAEYLFDFTGAEQTFVAPASTYYSLETWGAQGGTANGYRGGYGGYSSGEVYLQKNEALYINVGGAGAAAASGSTFTTGGYNGGGNANYAAGTGGGATSIAKTSGTLSNLASNVDDILIVSGGGGGAGVFAETNFGGAGGGITGTTGGHYSTKFAGGGGGGTQSAGGSLGSGTTAGTVGTFGAGGQGGYETSYTQGAGAGGGGFYGGAGGSARNGGGGGGSGYIGNTLLTNKVMYCYNCTSSDDESTKTISTTCAEETPTENCAKKGSGYAKITLVS